MDQLKAESIGPVFYVKWRKKCGHRLENTQTLLIVRPLFLSLHDSNATQKYGSLGGLGNTYLSFTMLQRFDLLCSLMVGASASLELLKTRNESRMILRV